MSELTVSVSPVRASALLEERAAAEAEAQAAPTAVLAPEELPPDDEVWTEEGHQLAVTTLCDMLPVLGGERVPPDIEASVSALTKPASKKYGGTIPYAAEIMGAVGIGLLVKWTFWPPPKREAEPEPKVAAA